MAACLKKVQKGLPYPAKKQGPFHFESITVYVAKEKKLWRVKPGYGRRDERMVAMGDDPVVKWADVQKRAAEHLSQL